ncbi:UvrD-helicase domain-containing protein [Desulfovibrio sp. OttesenSCG-928-O18]|nr:UvrD-helicase domain-containing protein [Desulfovibrio sp. OttesenSCG-928-O18]
MASRMEQITASAGSGKTYALTRHFLAHLAKALPDGGPSLCLLEGAQEARGANAPYSLGGILAATFTNKAASEMQARVVKELKQQALASGEGDSSFPLSPDQARHWIEVVLRRFDAVNIRTIDSLLSLLVRLNALALSLPPDFTPLFSLEEALVPLYDTLLDQAADEPGGKTETLFREACRSLLFHNRAKGLAAGDMLRDRLKELVTLHLSGATLPGPEHGAEARARLMNMHGAFCDAANALDGLAEEERLDINYNARKFLDKCRACPPMTLPDLKSAFARKESLDEWLNRASKGKASDDALRAFADLMAACEAFTAEGPALLTTIEYLPLVALVRPLVAGIDAAQSGEGQVPAVRLPALALESLAGESGVTEAFCRLGDTLTHLLFDEFQDTSEDQWQAILPLAVDCLSRGGSLTYVGDVKQAIYGWRGGNADLFDAVARDPELTAMLENGPRETVFRETARQTVRLENGALQTTLTANWRSAPAIVELNNLVFGPLAETDVARHVVDAMLPTAVDEELRAHTARTLSAFFTQSAQSVPEKNAAKQGYARLIRMEGENAAELLATIKEKLHALLLDEVLSRRSPGEVAVLVRTNDQASHVAEWLAEWQVPVVTEHSFQLGNHPLVARLVDALAFLEYPLDDAAFWSAVSGPELFAHINGPGPDELAEWLAETRGQPGSGPLFLAFRKAFPKAWRRMLAPFHDQAGLFSAYDTVGELIRHCRLFERYPQHAPFLRRFAEVAHTAENKGFSSLSAFLGFWAEAGQEERVPMPENMDAVRILSMHKAKGLEFPVVIVPFQHQADPRWRPLAAETRNGLPLLFHRDNSSPEAVRGTVEQINLLYVAWTRPSEELYAFITKNLQKTAKSAMGRALEALLENLEFTDGVYAHGVIPPGKPAPQSAPEPAPQAAPPVAETDDVQLMSWLPRLKIFRNQESGKGFSERQRGLLAHACLEALRFTENGTPEDVRSDVVRAVSQGLRAFPVPMPDPEAVRRDMEDMLAWYASLPQTAAWIRHGSPEQPVMDEHGGLRRVDLLVDAPGSPLLAVEYKTGGHSSDHIAQVERYLSLLAPAVRRGEPQRAVAGVVVYLDSRELVPVNCPENGGGHG